MLVKRKLLAHFGLFVILSMTLVTCAPRASALNLALSASPTTNPNYTTDVTLTATITPWLAGYSGTIAFTDNGLSFQTANVPNSSGGVITVTVTNIYPGPHNFSATYTGAHGAHPTGTTASTYGVTVVPVPPSGSVYIGAQVLNKNGYGPTSISDLESSSNADRTMAMHLEYFGWSNDNSNLWTSDPKLADDFTNGRIPLVSWNCVPTNGKISDIAADSDYIDHIAQGLATLSGQGQQVMLRWCWEMNLPGNAKNYTATTEAGQETEFIGAWQYLIGRIRSDFASPVWNPNNNPLNVIFVFNPGTHLASSNPIGDLYYPGDEYVDWIGLDKYNDNSSNIDFATTPGITTFPPSTSQVGFYPTFTNSTPSGLPIYPATGYDKPLLIGETGARFCGPTSSCTPDNTDVQASYISSASSEIPTTFPMIKAFFYFSSSGPAGDWELDGSVGGGGGLAQFRNMGCSFAFLYPSYTCP